jgi:hypothetical protein
MDIVAATCLERSKALLAHVRALKCDLSLKLVYKSA